MQKKTHPENAVVSFSKIIYCGATIDPKNPLDIFQFPHLIISKQPKKTR